MQAFVALKKADCLWRKWLWWWWRLGKKMDMSQCLEILRRRAEPAMAEHGAKRFLQDGALCHRAKTVTAWLPEKEWDIIDWPGNSPDLNPIENLWNCESLGSLVVPDCSRTLPPPRLLHAFLDTASHCCWWTDYHVLGLPPPHTTNNNQPFLGLPIQ